MKVAPRPFDRGSVRAAHKAREYNADGITFRDLIHKINLSQKREHLTRQAYEENAIANQVAAICFAEEFERVKPSGAATIEFAEVFLLQYLEKTGVPYCAVETELKGVWLKYNNNSGMVRRSTYDSGDQEHDIIQCFSHWTFERSGGRMLVVDCQGTFNAASNSYLLTDPAIHCGDYTRFGGTNLGHEGIKKFFKTHECNKYCRQMSLTVQNWETLRVTG